MRNGICMFGIKVHAKAGQAATTKKEKNQTAVYILI